MHQNIKDSKKLDKFYTKSEIAQKCYLYYKDILITHNFDLKNIVIIEPSAGNGVFLNIVEELKYGFDINPCKSTDNIIQNDYLLLNIKEFLVSNGCHKDVCILGNPPFGKKSKLAIQFINKAIFESKIVGFILPIQFRKWSAQSKINNSTKLILDITLPQHSFTLVDKSYDVRCCFQIWIRDDVPTKVKDLRLKDKPAIIHPDFEMFQYNRTEAAKKFFDYAWDFAVPRQGYADYSTKFTSKEDLNFKQQWIFFKASNKTILKRLYDLDYEKLSKLNTGTPGFGKADVVCEYSNKYEND